jgi:hypothetical protein
VETVFVNTKLARRVRTDQRWDAGVEDGGGQPRSNAKKGRSLDVDQRSRCREDQSLGVELVTSSEKDSRGDSIGTV